MKNEKKIRTSNHKRHIDFARSMIPTLSSELLASMIIQHPEYFEYINAYTIISRFYSTLPDSSTVSEDIQVHQVIRNEDYEKFILAKDYQVIDSQTYLDYLSRTKKLFSSVLGRIEQPDLLRLCLHYLDTTNYASSIVLMFIERLVGRYLAEVVSEYAWVINHPERCNIQLITTKDVIHIVLVKQPELMPFFVDRTFTANDWCYLLTNTKANRLPIFLKYVKWDMFSNIHTLSVLKVHPQLYGYLPRLTDVYKDAVLTIVTSGKCETFKPQWNRLSEEDAKIAVSFLPKHYESFLAYKELDARYKHQEAVKNLSIQVDKDSPV